MKGRNTGILTFAASALGTSAFLLPPNVAPASNDEAGALTVAPGAFNAKQAAISLPCSDCQFSNPSEEKSEDVEDEEPLFWIQGGANNIIVNFTISEDGQKLNVNGGTVWPLFHVSDLLAQKTYVSQVASSVSIKDVEAGKAKALPLEITGSGVSVLDEEVVSPDGDVLIPIKHTIFGLQNQPVSIDSISVKLIKSKSGELFIAHVEAEKATAPRSDDFFGPPPEWMDDGVLLPFAPHHHHKEQPHEDAGREKECKMLPAALCKLRIMLEDRLRGMREGGLRHGWKKPGCHGRKGGRPHGGMMPGHIKPNFFRPGQEDGAPHHHGRPHHMRPHGGHHGHHHGHHQFMHSFTHGLFAVLIPTMAGIAVGMAVSLVGLGVGRLIGFLWIKFYRGGRRGGYQSVQLDDDEVADDDFEKAVVIVEGDHEPLPKYEEAPAYEEAAEKEVR